MTARVFLSLLVLAVVGGTATTARAQASATGPVTSSGSSTCIAVRYSAGTPAAVRRGLARRVGALRRLPDGPSELLIVRARKAARALSQARGHARVRSATLGCPAASASPTRAPTQAPDDPLWPEAWGLRLVNAPEAWARTAGVPDTIVAVLDTGVDPAHPDLQGALVPGWDFVGGDADASDDHGHGTLVAGVIAARGNNGLGAVGLCWRCSVMPVKVIAADGRGNAEDVAAGILWAVDRGADVVNLSLVLEGPDARVEAAVRYALDRNVVVVAGAGNDGRDQARYPAALPGVIGVAGTDADDAVSGWSSFGSWVTVAAPGCNVTTALGGSYGVFCGTSSAAAAVAGVVALARSLAPELPVADLRALLAASAAPIGAQLGGGRIDAGSLLGRLARLAAPAPAAEAPAADRSSGAAALD